MGAATLVGNGAAPVKGERASSPKEDAQVGQQRTQQHTQPDRSYPRKFRERQLKMISFPLGGVAAGSLGLGGRGQLVDWEMFNRPNKGFRPIYAFPAIWAQVEGGKPIARVLESRIQPPYAGADGLGSGNVPGLGRLESAVFTGEYPLARIDFEDRTLPVKVSLDAFSPFIPHEPDDSGLPVAILRYTVTNPANQPADVSIAFSIENPVNTKREYDDDARQKLDNGRRNDFRQENGVAGLVMSNSALAADNPMNGEIALAAKANGAEVSHWQGWPAGRWWNAPLHFWDQFSKNGVLGDEPDAHNMVGVLCLKRTIPAGQTASFEFFIGWR